MITVSDTSQRIPGEDEPKPTPPPHSQPEPDVPEPDQETRDLVRPVQTLSRAKLPVLRTGSAF